MPVRKSIALGGLMLERQTNALVLRSWSGEHPFSTLLQFMPRGSDARFHRRFSVK